MSLLLSGMLAPARPAGAEYEAGNLAREVIIGADNDNSGNVLIQPTPVGLTTPNQSIFNTDLLFGGGGNDIIVGLAGADVINGESGADILVGGTEQGTTPNSDVLFGDGGDDLALWAPGDGNEVFDGGPGNKDALIVGVIDRGANNVPTLLGASPGYPSGIPTADVTGAPGFCTLEKVTAQQLGYDFLVRFFERATGQMRATIRLKNAEQIFCPSVAGGAIVYADLTSQSPVFIPVAIGTIQALNDTASRIVR